MLETVAEMPWTDLVGLVGVVIYIGSYFGLQAGVIKGQGYLYAALNIAAAGCVLTSLADNFNLSSAVIQITYIGISIFGITLFYLRTRAIKFTDEEQTFLNIVAPNLARHKSRQLVDLGVWIDAMPGTVLAEEGKTVSQLSFKLRGKADVTVNNQTVANLDAQSLDW